MNSNNNIQEEENDFTSEAQTDRKLNASIGALNGIIKNITEDEHKLIHAEKIIHTSIHKREKLKKKYNSKILRVELMIEQGKTHPKHAEILKESLEKKEAKITKKTFNKLRKIMTGMNIESLVYHMNTINNEIDEEMKKIAEAESQEIKLHHKIAGQYHKYKNRIKEKISNVNKKITK